jgi:succinate dehydrogenase/fumarate reductase flavoprotein subunit
VHYLHQAIILILMLRMRSYAINISKSIAFILEMRLSHTNPDHPELDEELNEICVSQQMDERK